MLLLAAASALPVPPQPPASGLITQADYPAEALRGERQGAVLFNLFVDPRGKALNCAVEEVYDADFSRIVCAKVRQATFRPAMNRDGKPAYGFIRTVANIWLPPGGKRRDLSDRAVAGPVLLGEARPGLLTARRDVRLAVVVNGKGGIADCAPASEQADAPAGRHGLRAAQGAMDRRAARISAGHLGELCSRTDRVVRAEGAAP